MKTQKFDPKNNDHHAFGLIIAQSFPHDRFMTEEEHQWIMQWFRREDIQKKENQIREGWWRDLRILGLNDFGKLDRGRLKFALKYIWSCEGEKPDFDTLKLWLSANDAEVETQMKAKVKAAQKKKKMQRKQRKLGRKRR